MLSSKLYFNDFCFILEVDLISHIKRQIVCIAAMKYSDYF